MPKFEFVGPFGYLLFYLNFSFNSRKTQLVSCNYVLQKLSTLAGAAHHGLFFFNLHDTYTQTAPGTAPVRRTSYRRRRATLGFGRMTRGEEEPLMQREEDIAHGSVWCWCRRLAEEERRGF